MLCGGLREGALGLAVQGGVWEPGQWGRKGGGTAWQGVSSLQAGRWARQWGTPRAEPLPRLDHGGEQWIPGVGRSWSPSALGLSGGQVDH